MFFDISFCIKESSLFSEDSVSDFMDKLKVTLDRKKATNFQNYRRWFWPGIEEECYHEERCSREEVDESFSSRGKAVS